MGKKGLIADAVIVGGTAAGVAVADLFFGTNVWDSIKEFYQAHPVGAGFATAAGLDVLGSIASQKVRQAHEYVLSGAGLAYVTVGAALAVRGLGTGMRRLGNSLKNDYTQFNAKSLELVRNNAGTVLLVGGVTVLGLATAIGIMASKGLDYKLTDADKREIAGYVTAVPGLAGAQGEKGDNGPQGLAGPQGIGIQGEKGDKGEPGAPGSSPSKQDIAQAVEDYFATHPSTPPPAPAPAAKFELNHSVPKSLYDAAPAAAQSSLVAALKPQAVKSGVNDLESRMGSATKLEFSDTDNQVRIYTGPDLTATIGYSSEADFDSVVATDVLTQFKTVPFISGADYSVALADAGISKKLGEALVNIPITDRKGSTFVSHEPSKVISFLHESVDKYGPAQVEFGRDGNTRLLYEGSVDRVPFHTIRTTPSQQAVIMDAMLK